MAGQPELCRAGDALPIDSGISQRLLGVPGALLDLDKDDCGTLLGHQVDFAQWRFESPIADTIEFQLQPDCGQRLAAMAAPIGRDPTLTGRS
ncbi:hypothetical protein D3C71_2050250 [compost metagenome]